MSALPNTSGFITKLALVYIGAVPFSVAIFLPVIVGGLVSDLALGDHTAGYIVAADMAGFALASLVSYLWLPRANWRTISYLASIIFIIANLMSISIESSIPLFMIRFIAGFSAGTVSASVVSAIAKTENPDRLYGFWLITQFAYAIVGFMFAPCLLGRWTIDAAFICFAILSTLSIPLIKYIPTSSSSDKTPSNDYENPAISPFQFSAGCSVVAIFLFYIGLNAVWAYFERVGDHYGLSAEAMGQAFTLANIVAVVGALLIVYMDLKKYRTALLYILLILITISIVPLLGNISVTVFTISASIFLFSWCVAVPLMFGAIADMENPGKIIALANAALSWGLALGPAVGAYLYAFGGYSTIVWVGIASFITSLLLFLAAGTTFLKSNRSFS